MSECEVYAECPRCGEFVTVVPPKGGGGFVYRQHKNTMNDERCRSSSRPVRSEDMVDPPAPHPTTEGARDE